MIDVCNILPRAAFPLYHAFVNTALTFASQNLTFRGQRGEIRYNTRAVRPASTGIVEQFLDSRYDDGYIERRRPSMIVTEP